MNFNKNRLAEVISAELKVPIVITSDGEVIDKNRELNEFNVMLNLLERQFISTSVMYEEFGVDLTIFMNPVQDLNEILLRQIYGEVGFEYIYQFVINRDLIDSGTPLQLEDGSEIVDILTLFNAVSDEKQRRSGSSNRSKK